ncbi:hypothetical protein [Streptomyces sp. CBMA29]|uniref:hypothetical protein n=1 Tax=Streptomyces sp. CBMA29 TaxID=1896314 RepID=UPI001661D013|nr:hypothetical protein [Streptomyces sp. CBMA29]MBD0739816.1 hypothetical protein [Streptomyces sp. CBMA29]
MHTMTAGNGKCFQVEEVRPEDLKAADRVFYHSDREGYVTILAVGAVRHYLSEYRPGETVVRVPVLAHWDRDGWPDMWEVTNGMFSRIVADLN